RGAEPAHDGTAVRHALDQSLRREAAEGLAQGAAADAELAREIGLDEALARRVAAVKNAVLQVGHDTAHGAAAAAALRSGGGRIVQHNLSYPSGPAFDNALPIIIVLQK